MAWELLSEKFGEGGSSIDSGTITAKKYLHVNIFAVDGTAGNFQIQFNGSSNADYATRRSYDGGSWTNLGNQTKIISYSATSSKTSYLVLDIYNDATMQKTLIGHTIDVGTAGAGTSPNRAEYRGSWNDTSNAITGIQVLTNSGDGFTTEAYMQVFGTD